MSSEAGNTEDWRSRIKFRLGWVDFTDAVETAEITSAINEMNSAVIDVRVNERILDRLDFTARVIIESLDDEGEWHIRFSGRVSQVEHQDSYTKFSCLGAVELSLTPSGVLVHREAGIDVFEALIYDSGLPHEPHIEGDERPTEVFEILAPATQLETTGPMHFGTVSVVTPGSALELLQAGPSIPPQFLDQVRGQSAFLRTFVQARRMYDAQLEAEMRFDEALARLVIAARYSTFRLPTGELFPWDRQQTRFDPQRLPIVIVSAVAGPRFYVRRTGLRSYGYSLSAEAHPLASYSTTTPPPGELAMRQAYVLCARAARLGEPIDRVTYLWQSLEFLLGGVSVKARIFPKEKIKEIRRVRREHLSDLSEEQAARLDDLIGQLNDPPLLAKLRKLLSDRSIPIEEAEMHILVKLRRFRNDANHGREPQEPQAEEIELGVAVVARILTYYTSRGSD